MVLGFKKQFKDKVLSGSKIHTVREDKSERWKRGKKIHFATGVRTKNYEEFKTGECKGVQDVFMTYTHLLQISINGHELFDYGERLKFAKNDGFETLEEMEEWFYPIIKAAPDECYSAKLIHWTDFRY